MKLISEALEKRAELSPQPPLAPSYQIPTSLTVPSPLLPHFFNPVYVALRTEALRFLCGVDILECGATRGCSLPSTISFYRWWHLGPVQGCFLCGPTPGPAEPGLDLGARHFSVQCAYRSLLKMTLDGAISDSRWWEKTARAQRGSVGPVHTLP